jgi:hypothetical protein
MTAENQQEPGCHNHEKSRGVVNTSTKIPPSVPNYFQLFDDTVEFFSPAMNESRKRR